MSPRSKKTNEPIPAIFVENLNVKYGDNVVVDDISFSVGQGTVAAIVGPNGSGKTTLMKAILGLAPFRGEALVLGQHFHEVRGRVGYVPQRFTFDRDFPITVEEFLHLALGTKCLPSRILTVIKEVGLTPLVLHKRLGTLSGGQLQRILIAQAILNDPAILFLDEPSTGIDVAGETAIHDVIEHLNKEHHTTILMVSHDIAMISCLVDQVLCLNKKLLCSGPPKKALTQKSLGELFGPHHSLYEHHQHHHEA
ncbi:MAG: metal ABC transporter ATP-binding protein [Patescibacteria group bacterium]|jgi:ABC-type Mn2+/Zn2+ transport system ATPase subunit